MTVSKIWPVLQIFCPSVNLEGDFRKSIGLYIAKCSDPRKALVYVEVPRTFR